jgi:hypothetical protein
MSTLPEKVLPTCVLPLVALVLVGVGVAVLAVHRHRLSTVPPAWEPVAAAPATVEPPPTPAPEPEPAPLPAPIPPPSPPKPPVLVVEAPLDRGPGGGGGFDLIWGQYVANEAKADIQYLNKTIEVTVVCQERHYQPVRYTVSRDDSNAYYVDFNSTLQPWLLVRVYFRSSETEKLANFPFNPVGALATITLRGKCLGLSDNGKLLRIRDAEIVSTGKIGHQAIPAPPTQKPRSKKNG